MIFFIHYRPDDGEILGWGYGFEPEPIEGMAVALVEGFLPDPPDPLTQKFNGAAVVEKTTDEQRRARRPKLYEVRMAIWTELDRTDKFMLPDYPIDDDARDDWKAYRQLLRLMSKHSDDPVDLIRDWDLPPDGADPISDLRKRL